MKKKIGGEEEKEDGNVLGAHILIKHGKRDERDFDECFTFDIITTCNPDSLRLNEQTFISRLGTLYPLGLNNVNSVS